MPVYDFATVDELLVDNEFSTKPKYNWGFIIFIIFYLNKISSYDPLNYFIPEGSYCTNIFDPTSRIRELKELVIKLHNSNIRVIMDVVFNHTWQPHKLYPYP